jgi:hypothetical protein
MADEEGSMRDHHNRFWYNGTDRLAAFASFVYMMKKDLNDVGATFDEKRQSRKKIYEQVKSDFTPEDTVFVYDDGTDKFSIRFVHFEDDLDSDASMRAALLEQYMDDEPWPATIFQNRIYIAWKGSD